MRISAAIALVAMATTSLLATSANADAVVELDEKNFLDHIAYKDLVMINFYTNWCGHCKNLEPEFEKAAKILEPEGVPLAKINCETHVDFCKDHAVKGYPSLKVYKKGKVTDYKSSRKADDLVAYMRKHVGPAVKQLKPEEVKEFSESGRVVVVGVLPKGADREVLAETLEKAAEYYRDDFAFGAVESSPDIKGSGIILYKKFDEGKNVLDGNFNDHTLINFIREHYTPTIDEMGPKNYKHYLESNIPLGYLFFGSEEDQAKYSKDLEALAKELKGQMNFDVSRNTSRLSARSEAIPEKNDGPVAIVVAHNYKDIVEDETKDVLIEFYAPWCGFCKMLAPIYDEVGELYKGTDIVIAKFDSTANDLPPSVPFHVDGYPTIKFRKAGTKDYIDYKGERSKEGFVSFLARNAENKVDVGIEIKLKSEAIPEDNDGPVAVVVGNSYKDIVEDETKDVLIEFYAPWCGFCKKLEPIYDEVGELYKGSDIVIAKFDATVNELPTTIPFQIDGYPTIKFRKAGSKEYIDYKGDRTKEGFVKFLNKNAVNKFAVDIELKLKSEAIPEKNDGPVTVVVADSYKDIVEDETKDVLIEFYAPWCGFCKMLAPVYDEVGVLYKGTDIVIAKFDAVANELPPSVPFPIEGYPTIKFRKAGTKEYVDYKGERTKEGFVGFLARNAENKVDVGVEIKLKSEAIPETNDGPVTVVVADTYKSIVEDETKDVLIEFYAPWCGFCKMLAPIYDEVGELYKGSNIVVAKFDAVANELPLTVPFQVDGYPTIKFRKAGSKEYIDYNGDRSKEGFVKFLASNAENKVDVGIDIKVKSEAVPETNDGPVTVVVADSYKDIVEDETKDVLIEFYAPWCGFCKMLAPIYDEVGELYKGSDIVIAKFDAVANELPGTVPFKIGGYPTIKFRKAGTKEYIDYKGQRTKEAFVKFLAENAVNKVDVKSTIHEVEHNEL
ncbi:Protein O-glucosyltransferase 2 [Podila epigama]|nr:Protein O-glucosyltransferase 2 [Podila epigama]